MNSPDELRHQLFTEGYCVAPGLLGETLLQRLRKAIQPIIKSDRDSASSHFGLITACPYDNDAFAALIAWPPALQLLHEMGFEDNRWMSFYLIDKPPYSRPLWWHQDWLFWDDPMSATARPVQVFLSYYLEDTNVVNGCLRVIPGSHLPEYQQHLNPLKEQFGDTSKRPFGVTGAEVPAYAFESRPGDVIFASENLWHASFGGRPGRRMFNINIYEDPTTAEQVEYIRDLRQASTAMFYPHESFLNSDRPRIRGMVQRYVDLGLA